MKNKFKTLLLIAIFNYGNIAISQTYKTDESETTIRNISDKNVVNNFLATNSTNENTFTDDNTIFIQQIGDFNVVKANTTSENSSIALSQNGKQNNIYLDITAKTIEENVQQEGNNNYFLDFSSYGVDLHTANVVQQGNNQNITLFGGNSISEKIKINMQGDNKTIIVRNFN